MQVVKDTVVTVQFQVTDAQGEVIQESGEPMVYLHGGYGEVFEALETSLDGKVLGDEVWVQVEPEDAFGEYDADLMRVENRDLFPEVLEVGMQFEGVPTDAGEEGDEAFEDDAPIWTVTDVAEDKVILDGNHPLAGVALRYHLVVTDIRPATQEEIARGTLEEPDLGVQISSQLH